MNNIEKLRNFFESEEGQEKTRKYFQKLADREEIIDKQLERLHNSGNFVEFTEKVIAKYSTKKYRNRYFNRGIEPSEDLFWFLSDYAEKYGRECSDEEWDEYANMFTSSLYYCDGYYFGRMDGQGSVMKVIKENK